MTKASARSLPLALMFAAIAPLLAAQQAASLPAVPFPTARQQFANYASDALGLGAFVALLSTQASIKVVRSTGKPRNGCVAVTVPRKAYPSRGPKPEHSHSL